MSEIDDALAQLDPSKVEPVKEEMKQNVRQEVGAAAKAFLDMDDEDVSFRDTETHASDKMNMLYVGNKKPGYNYRWVSKSSVLRRKQQGWVVDREAAAIKQDGGEVNATHELVLMRIPTEKANKINQQWINKSNKLAKTLDYEDEGQKKMAVKYLKSKGVPARVIDSLL